MIPEDLFQVLDSMQPVDRWIKVEDGSWINFGHVSTATIGFGTSFQIQLTVDGESVCLQSGLVTRSEAQEYLDRFMKEMTE